MIKGLHIYFTKNWRNVIKKVSFAFKSNNIEYLGDELLSPTITQLREYIYKNNPDIIFNHIFCLKHTKDYEELIKENHNIKFITINHSAQNHSLNYQYHFSEIKKIVESSNFLNNLYFSTNDKHFDTSLCKNFIFWYNPVFLENVEANKIKNISPPSLAIVSRPDIIKSIPTQLAACSLLQKKRNIDVILMIPHNLDSDARSKINAITTYADLLKLKYLLFPWVETKIWYEKLMNEISIVLQTSFCEGFNYISLDAILYKRPFVGSYAINHTPKEWLVNNPNNVSEIVEKIEYILDNYEEESKRAFEIAQNITLYQNNNFAKTIKDLLNE